MGADARKRVLFIAEAVTLAHVARTVWLAGQLDKSRYAVRVACDDRYDALFDDVDVERYRIESVSNVAFMAALARGAPVYDTPTLMRYARADIEAIELFDPAVVVGDFRLSLSASARVCNKPYITVTNAGWSPFARPRFPVPDIPLSRFAGAVVAQWLFDLARPVAFMMHARPVNALRRQYGLAPLPLDLRFAYTDADHVLYADLPELFSLNGAPATHHHAGPVLWSPQLADPPWAHRIAEEQAIIYVSLGSSGNRTLLPVILEGLRRLSCAIVVATAGPGDFADSRDFFAAEYLDGGRWTKRASLVVCNGGSPSCYQALAEGVPILGIPSNLDQYLNMGAVAEAGAGILLRSGEVTSSRVHTAASTLLGSDRFVHHARRLAVAIDPDRPARVLAATIEAAVAR